jgi:hypothetical protein
MRQNIKNSGNQANRLFGRLAAEKKKTVTALCLIAVMAFMWIRVLSRNSPEIAQAAPAQKKSDEDISESNSELKISFIGLPKVTGRNDILTRDIFAAGGWQNFIRNKERKNGAGTEVSVISKGGNEEVVRRIADNLILEVISLDENPQVFINGKVRSVGDKLLVRDGVNTYECEVAGIEENVVLIKYGEAQITLKLTQTVEVSN